MPLLKPVARKMSTSYFPLSADHLIHLIQFNVFRAILTNMVTLRLSHLFSCESEDYMLISALPIPAAIPPTLEPTALQQKVPHAPYVDLFPLAGLRDALVRAEGQYDDCELCIDLLGSISQPQVEEEYRKAEKTDGDNVRTGLVVWGEPWRVESWEVEEGFVEKWGWMLQEGCEDLITSTNRWRELRGDEPLRWNEFGL